MTREQAIKHLEVIKGDCALVGDIRALDIAISALSTEGEYIKKADMERILYSTNNAVRIGEEFLELPTYSLPDSENKGEWIPIEEREPEVHKYVMFTTKTTRREIGYKAKEEPYYFLFGDSGAYVKSDYILAWMELPEPYKKGE